MKVLTSGCPQLDALFSESLRLCSASSSIRLVTKPATLGEKRFLPGDRLVAPFRQLHFNEQVYGVDAEMFDHERFLRDKGLTRSGSYRPFGGGVSYCPGRYIAMQEVRVFVTLVLHRFDISLQGSQRFPHIDAGKPTTGLMEPLPGEDVVMSLGQKK